jgi:Fe-S oxidoreductase
VAEVLLEARAAVWRHGAAPPAAQALSRRQVELGARLRERTASFVDDGPGPGRTALLLGCAATLHVPDEAGAAVELARWLGLAPFVLVRACCGLPWRLAGDHAAFEQAAQAFARELGSAARLVVLDPGCARTLREDYPKLGLALPPVELLSDRMAASVAALPGRLWAGHALRIHDSCQLARPLGASAGPRAVLARLLGEPPRSWLRSERQGECCGAGGLLPLTHPELSRAIADARIAEHHAQGSGTLVATCPSSVRRFRSRGEPAQGLAALVARALRAEPPVDHG